MIDIPELFPSPYVLFSNSPVDVFSEYNIFLWSKMVYLMKKTDACITALHQ